MEITNLMASRKYFVKDTGNCRLKEYNQSHAGRSQLKLYFTFCVFFCHFPVSMIKRREYLDYLEIGEK